MNNQRNQAIVLLTFLLTGLITACSDDDNSSPDTPNVTLPSTSPPSGSDTPPVASHPEVVQPESGGNVEAGELAFKFHRNQTEKLPPDAQKHNQEIVGRPFLISFFRKTTDGSSIEEISKLVTWTLLDSTCEEETCYKISPSNQMIGLSEGQLTFEVSYGNETTTPINFIVDQALKTCGLVDNIDNNYHEQTCLHIIEGKSGEAQSKWFTEPPRKEVISDVLRYTPDNSPYNTDYTHSGYASLDGTLYTYMRNDGHAENGISDAIGTQSQYARYCQDLANIEFNGRNNWRRVNRQELSDLITSEDIINTYGWPYQAYYTTSNIVDESHVDIVTLIDGHTPYWLSERLSTQTLPVCISENQ